jgi:HSP20 family protein
MAENTVDTQVATRTGNGSSPAQADLTRDESRYLSPAVDIYETEEGLTVEADMPGVARDGVDVRIEDSILTIRGRVNAESQGSPLFSEYELRDYFRQFKLNELIDQEKISAKLNNGVLCLELPHAAATRPRQVEVQVA